MSSNSNNNINNEDYTRTDFCKSGRFLAAPPPGEEIVISGLSGAYPDSRNVYEFRDNLFNKVDLVSGDTRRWEPGHPEIPQRTGKLFDIDRFDPGFFGIHYRQSVCMDPIMRLFLEKTIEALFDAGINPGELPGSKTGVFIGACYSETEKTWCFDRLHPQQYPATGIFRSMMARRISYFLKLKGPSFICDTACSSSLYAFEEAYKSLRNGTCDTAIVGGGGACLHPFVSLQFARLGVLSADGVCKVFDDMGDGYARSEAISVLILQKADKCRRNYGTVLHSKTNCDGFKPQSITYPSGEAQKKLMEDFYRDCRQDPGDLSFLEAHGTGTFVGDPEELQAVDEFFCSRRRDQGHLLIGSVKSNIGHSEPSSGVCSLTKVIIGMESGFIPPNIHFKTPRKGVQALEKGRLKVVTEKTKFEDDRGLIGVNSFGFGGGNAHVLLKWNQKSKEDNLTLDDGLDRIICISGRVPEGVNFMFDDVKGRGLDYELVRLYHQIFSEDIPNHLHRGFCVISKNRGEMFRSVARNCNKKPLILVFGNLTSSWASLARELYKINIFASAVERIHKILLAQGFDLTPLILNGKNQENSNFEQVLGTMTVQIGLVEIFRNLKLKVDAFLGLGFGELVCAYFDNVLTLEETVLSTFLLASNKNKTQVAHKLKKIICKPRKKSSLWISSLPGAKSKNVEYFLEILQKQSSDPFKKVPKSSVIVEMGESYTNLVNNNCEILSIGESFVQLLTLLGKLFQKGFNLQLHTLYPEIQFPVSRGTPMISPLIKWHHKDSWFVTAYTKGSHLKQGEANFDISGGDDEYLFVQGHVIDSRNLFPATGYLFLVWELFARINGFLPDDMQIVFENCKFLRATNVPHDSKIQMTVMIQRCSGNFEIIESDAAIVTGRIRGFKEGVLEQIDLPVPKGTDKNNCLYLKSKEIYKELRLRGYNYKGAFRQLKECNVEGTAGVVHWDDNWVTFMDNILQMKILQKDTRSLYVPTVIKTLSVDAKKHMSLVQELKKDADFPVYIYEDCDIIKCGGVEIRGLSANAISRRKPRSDPVLEKYVFIPNTTTLKLEDSIRTIVQLGIENLPGFRIKTVEVIDEATKKDFEPLAPVVNQVLGDLPLIQVQTTILTKEDLKFPNITVEDKKLAGETDCHFVVGSNLLERVMHLNQAFNALKENAFVITREDLNFEPKESNLKEIDILLTHTTESEKIYMLRKSGDSADNSSTVIDMSQKKNLSWMEDLKQAIKTADKGHNIIVLSQNDSLSGILGFVNCLRREPGCTNIKLVCTFDEAPKFSLDNPFYSEQLRKNLAVNVFKNLQWGTYRHLLLDSLKLVESDYIFCAPVLRGDLSSLRWFEGPKSIKNFTATTEKDLVYIYYCALNFRDIMTASGRISVDASCPDRRLQDFAVGFEFAGKTAEGKRVMGIVTGALSTMVQADRYLTWHVPDLWSLEEAATVPVVYATVLQSFFVECHIKKGESILIHAGSGGIGQAAINVALHHGLTVYTTVGTVEKREFLKKRFPQLKDRQIGCSRDTTFVQMISTQTHSKGVNYVLNCLSEEKLLASARCLARNGHFIEIGKFDLASNNALNLALLQNDCTFHGVVLDIFQDPKIKLRLHRLMVEGILNSVVKPLNRIVYKTHEIEQAFRFMAAGKHIGKILVQIRREEVDNKNLNLASVQGEIFKALPRFTCSKDKVQIIVGGLGGFGLELADWLIVRGAQHLILTSRRGISTGYQKYRIQLWRKIGVQVTISLADVTTTEGCKELIEDSLKIGRIETIFNLAVVLRDKIFENLTLEDIGVSLAPKSDATKFLDEHTRTLCPDLNKFVVFSSVSCGRGNAGQTNYGMANSIMERICERRFEDNLPSLAIQWGAIADVGLVAELQEEHAELEIGGTLQQKMSSCLQVLDNLLNQDVPIVGSMVVAEKKRGAAGADNIVDAVANILGLGELKTVSLHSSLAELGMDSMTAVEIKQTLEREYEVFLTPQDIRNMTFARLVEIQEERNLEDEDAKKNRSLGGFEMIVRNMNDELTSKIGVVKLKTQISADCGDNNLNHVIFFPGVEGVAKILENLSINLKVHADCLQFSYDTPQDSIRELAESLLPDIEELLQKHQTSSFKFVSYSFGTVVALEVIGLLESRGIFGTLICIDGSPDMLNELLRNSLNIKAEALFQTGFLVQLMSLHVPLEKILKYKDRLLMCRNFEERLDVGEEIVPKDTQFTSQYLRKFATALYKRLTALHNYEFSFGKLKSEVKLFKPTNVSVGKVDDYGLGGLCEREVDVRVFKGNHVTVLDNLEMAAAINEIFVEETVESGEKLLDKIEGVRRDVEDAVSR